MNKTDVLNTLLEMKKTSFDALISHADNRLPSIGVPYPELHKLASKIHKNSPMEYLNASYIAVYELEILEAFIIGKIKDIQIAMYYFDAFALRAKEWSMVDSLCQRFVITKKHPDKVFPLLKRYAATQDEYLQRVVAVMVLSHYLHDDTIDEALALLRQLTHEGYYAQMAVAWAYATVMINTPEAVIHVLKEHQLSPFAHAKTIQKIQESYRISEERKAEVKLLKRK